jgi:hypothetical protein
MGCCWAAFMPPPRGEAQQPLRPPPGRPLQLPGEMDLFLTQAVPERHQGRMDAAGCVRQNDFNKTIVGWVDADGVAYRNDYNRTVLGHVDLATGQVFREDYNRTHVGRVDAASGVVLVRGPGGSEGMCGRVQGPREGFPAAGCAVLNLWA